MNVFSVVKILYKKYLQIQNTVPIKCKAGTAISNTDLYHFQMNLQIKLFQFFFILFNFKFDNDIFWSFLRLA